MNRVSAAAGSLAWLLFAPGVVAGLIPWWLSDWDAAEAGPAWVPIRVLGGLLIVAGFVKGYEEPTLRRRFGAEYDAYRAAVPAWWPRRRAWRS